MLRLEAVQSAMASAILGDVSPELRALIDPTGLSPDARLRVYHNHLRITLTAALKAVFPVVCRLVDERFFDYAASAFIFASPPVAPCLSEYGAGFSSFLGRFPACSAFPYVADVARLEWAINAAIHADFVPCLDLATLAALPPAQAAGTGLVFHPGWSLMTSPWPVDQIWHAHQEGVPAEAFAAIRSATAAIEIFRQGDRIVIRPLDAGAFELRAALAGRASLETATTVARMVNPSFQLPFALRLLFDSALVVGLTRDSRAETSDRMGAS